MIKAIIWAIICTIIFPIAIAILIYLLILKIINKYIFKNRSKISYKEFTVGWIIIFVINVLCTTCDIPYPIGVPYTIIADGGQTKFYASLGYIILVEENNLFPCLICNQPSVSFIPLNMLENKEKKIRKKGYIILGYDECNGCDSLNTTKKFGIICDECAEITKRCEKCGKIVNAGGMK